MFGPQKIYKSPLYMVFSRVLNLYLNSTKICIFLGLCLLFRVQCLDVDSAVCRCTTTSKFGKPFVVLWNSPTGGCHVNFSVHIELEKYGILTNSNQTWDGEVVTVFYNAQLGLYPFYRYEDKKMKINDGLPQLVNLTEHLKKVSQHISEKIPEPRYSGLAVIDWEGWRPLWVTNFGKKRLYQTESIALVKKEGKLKKKSEIEAEAKKRFERSGKRLIIETIELAKILRPRALWGFYGYPGCHGNITTGYHCTKKNKKWNNKLHWLYKRCTALFPSIYLMEEHTDNDKFVAARLTEAFRVSQTAASRGYGHELPVFPYLRPLYHVGARQFKMLNVDLHAFNRNKTPKSLAELIEITWKVQEAPATVEQEASCRISQIREAAAKECECNGEWMRCSREILAKNHIKGFVFASALRQYFIKRRKKNTNVLLVESTNCGKPFLLNPAELIFKTFVKPATSRYAWVGLDGCEVAYLNDFCWTPEVIAWSDFLLLLEGQTVHLPRPKNQFATDMLIDRTNTIPFFCTS